MSNRKSAQQTEPIPDPTINVVSNVDTLGELVASIEEGKPDASPNVQQLMAEEIGIEADTNTPIGSGQSPSIDNRFDSSIHVANADGSPKLNKDGTFRRRRGKKNAVGTGSISKPVTAGPTPEQLLEAKTAAMVTVQCVLIIATTLGGEEWRAEKGEQTSMETAWEQYYIVSGAFQPPPWLLVIVATSMYAGPRIRLPKTQSKLKLVWGWICFKMGW